MIQNQSSVNSSIQPTTIVQNASSSACMFTQTNVHSISPSVSGTLGDCSVSQGHVAPPYPLPMQFMTIPFQPLANREFTPLEAITWPSTLFEQTLMTVDLLDQLIPPLPLPVPPFDVQEQNQPSDQASGSVVTHPVKIMEGTRKKYLCNHCEKRFTISSALKNHIRSHTGEKPFCCPIASCGKSFGRKEVYDNHILTHGEGKAYQCPTCPYGCNDRRGIKFHQSSKHGINDYQPSPIAPINELVKTIIEKHRNK